MKKLVLVLAMLMLLPATSFGIQYDLMNNGSMDTVTGQSGVAIAIDDIQIFMNIDRVAWLDCDGYYCENGYTNDGGAVGIGNFQLDVLAVNAPDSAIARESVAVNNGATTATVWDLTNANPCSEIDLKYDYGDTALNEGSCSLVDSAGIGTQTLGLNNYESVGDPLDDGRFIPRPLTIDASSRLPIMTQMRESAIDTGNANVGGVIIGLPTIEISIPTLTLTPAFYNVEGAQVASNAKDEDTSCDYGTVVLDGVTMTVLSGWVEIAPTCSDGFYD